MSARSNDVKRALLRKHKAWFEQGAWRFPSVWNKEQFEKEYNAWLNNNLFESDSTGEVVADLPEKKEN